MEVEAITETDTIRRPLGRPRAFNTDKALGAAMQVFWRKGYEGTSLSDLTAAMGVNRPSLYAAFGDKEALFREVLNRYAAGPAAYMQAALSAPTARAAVERLLFGAVDLLTNPENPSMCLIAQGTLVCGEEADIIRREVSARRQKGEGHLRARLKRAVSEGELPPDTDAAALALYFATVARGLGVSASSGAGRKELLGVVQMALRLWPGRSASPQSIWKQETGAS